MGIAGSRHADDRRSTLVFLLVLVLTVILAAAAPQATAAEEPAIATAARVGGDDIRTRFVADLTKPVSFNVYVLPDPYRVMIDLPDVTFNLPPGIGKETRGLITEYRYGQVSPGRARIVIDTTGPVLIEKSFVVDPKSGQPARIVVDLVQTTEEAFLKTYMAEEGVSEQAAAEAGAADQPDEIAKLVDDGAPAEEAPPAMKKPDGKKVVVIDPGHGGVDPGAIGIHRTREKDVTLAAGLKLRDALEKSGYGVIMTRSTDEFVTLRNRVKAARESGADLFIALHADTVKGPEARGATIYTLSEKASDAEAEELAQKENRADIINGIDLGAESAEVTDILIDLVQRESKGYSMVFARKAVAEMKQVTAFTGKPLRSAGFVVLKAPDVPSVLVELGYLSTKSDEAQLAAGKWQAEVAQSLARAVDEYFATEVAQRN